jgi:hypothetical protein
MTTPTFSLTAATASQVLDPLMVAVFEASHKEPRGATVHWNSVLSAFTTLTGLDMDSFGTDTRGYPRLKTAISGAWGNAKKNGWADKSARRYYCLTTEGVAKAVAISGLQPVSTTEPTTTTPEPAAPAEPTPIAKIVVVEPKGTVGVSWNNPSGTPTATHTTYDGDAYFRSLAAANTRCFGKWSAKANACKECPLAALCYGTQVTRIAEIAHTLDMEWEAKVAAPAVAPTPTATPVPTPTPTPTLPEGAKLMPVAFETVCTACGKVCPEGVEAVHIPGLGVFHSACATTQ